MSAAPGTEPAMDLGDAGRRRAATGPARSVRSFITIAAPLIAVIVITAIYTNSRNPAFLSGSNIENILVQSSVLGIIAVGQTFLLVGGQLDLSVGSLASLVSVLAATRYTNGWSTPVIITVCLLLGAAIGLIWGLVVTYLRVPPFILTLGGLSVLGSFALVLSNSRAVPVPDFLSELGFGEIAGLPTPAVLLFAVTIVGLILLHFTRFGRNVFAMGSSPQAAFLAGIPTRRLTIVLFTLNSTLVALAGLLLMSRLAAGDPRGGAGLELSAIAAIVLGGASLAGGRGSMIGTFLGVLVFGVVGASLTFLGISGAYQEMVTGGILIIAVTLTAISDLRGNARASRQAARDDADTGVLDRFFRRPPAPPAGTTRPT